MRNGVIDQILLWIVLFISFVTIFLMVIDYYIVIKIKDKCESLSNYGSRMKALGKDAAEIVSGLNIVKGDYFSTILESNLTCTPTGTSNYIVSFSTNIFISNKFLSSNEKIYTHAATYNEVNAIDINCSLNLSTPN